MSLYNVFLAIIVMNILPACADSKSEDVAIKNERVNMNQFKWKNRVILSYPKTNQEWRDQEKLLLGVKDEIDDRDLIIIRVNEQQAELIEKHKLQPGSHLLIGKDGDAKSKQKGKLDLQSYFRLIDQVPMRRTEMRPKEN